MPQQNYLRVLPLYPSRMAKKNAYYRYFTTAADYFLLSPVFVFCDPRRMCRYSQIITRCTYMSICRMCKQPATCFSLGNKASSALGPLVGDFKSVSLYIITPLFLLRFHVAILVSFFGTLSCQSYCCNENNRHVFSSRTACWGSQIFDLYSNPAAFTSLSCCDRRAIFRSSLLSICRLTCCN